MGWFSKKELMPVYSAKQIHDAVSIQSLAFVQELIKYNEKILENSSIESELKRLKSLGLSSSKNYMLLENKMTSIKEYNNFVEKFNKIRDLLTEVKETFTGLDCRFLSFEDFEKILYKYDLRCGTLDMYTGDIPEKNIKEIEFVKGKLKSLEVKEFRNDLYLKHIDVKPSISKLGEALKTIKVIKEISFYSTYLDRIESTNLKENMIMFPFWFDDETPMKMQSRFYKKKGNELMIQDIRTDRCVKYDVFIAAPSRQIKNNLKFRFAERAKSEDPIIFSITNYGILCYTAWGEEANDVYKQYEHIIEEVNKISI